jgi:hypothetical protein
MFNLTKKIRISADLIFQMKIRKNDNPNNLHLIQVKNQEQKKLLNHPRQI